MEERTGWRGQNESQILGEEKKNGRLVGAAETSKERAEWRRLQRKNLNIAYWACRKGKSGLSATERAVGKNAGAALAKRKRNRAVCPEYQIMREEKVKVGESRTLARERKIRAGAWRGEVDSTVNEGRFQAMGGQARRASLEQVEGSMCG